MKSYDVVIIGAGAAGLMAAGLAGQAGLRVALLEHNHQVGRKILISGGGRCNFTNLNPELKDYASGNEHFAKSAMARYRSEDFIGLVERYGIEYYEKKLGQLFCRHSAKEIVDMLLAECRQGGVELLCRQKITQLEKTELGFVVKREEGDPLEAPHLVIATGGLSVTPLGASDFGYRIARQFGLRCTETRPALVPFVLDTPFAELSGVSLRAEAKVGKRAYLDDLLFTHKGLSGPVILKISLFWDPKQVLRFNLLPERDLLAELQSLKRRQPKQTAFQLLKQELPTRLVEHFFDHFQLKTGFLGELSEKELRRIAQTFQDWQVTPKETEGYRKAEVTRGGVATDELSSKSMEAKNVPGLYFIGEVVDVTGLLGGYNFQWAWASAYAAAQDLMLKTQTSQK